MKNNILYVYWLLFCMILPIFFAMSPTIIYINTDNGNWMYLMFISFPIGVSIAIKTWDSEFINKPFDKKITRSTINLDKNNNFKNYSYRGYKKKK